MPVPVGPVALAQAGVAHGRAPDSPNFPRVGICNLIRYAVVITLLHQPAVQCEPPLYLFGFVLFLTA